MKVLITSVVVIASIFLNFAVAEPVKTDISLSAECTTDGTKWDGSRNDCKSSKPSCYDAPAGFVIVEKSVSPVCTSCNGSQNSCDISFSNQVEVVAGTGITQPRQVCLTATATSPGGMANANARGWSKCVASAKLTSYK